MTQQRMEIILMLCEHLACGCSSLRWIKVKETRENIQRQMRADERSLKIMVGLE